MRSFFYMSDTINYLAKFKLKILNSNKQSFITNNKILNINYKIYKIKIIYYL